MAFSVSQLIDLSKASADKRSDGSIQDTPDWVQYINWANETVWRKLIALDPGLYFAQSNTFTLTATETGAAIDLSTLTYTPTGTFRILKGVDLNPGLTTRRTILRRNFRERNMPAISWWVPTLVASDRRYDERGRTLVITPFEAAAGNYRVYATCAPYLFTGTGDANPLDWQLEQYAEVIVDLAGRRTLRIEESDLTDINARISEIYVEMQGAHRRDDEAAVIGDVEDEDFRSTWPA